MSSEQSGNDVIAVSASKRTQKSDETVTPEVFVETIFFSDGKIYNLKKDDLIVIVGPNNSGKSLALREIRDTFNSPDITALNNKCVKTIGLNKNVNGTQLENYFKKTFKLKDEHYVILKSKIHRSHASFIDQVSIHVLGPVFCNYVGAEGRIQASNPAANIDIDTQKTAPLQFLYDDEPMLERVSELFKSAFGQELMIDYRAGSIIPIYVGNKVALSPGESPVSQTYIERLRKLPRLDQQGDGMRSFAGIVFETIVTEHMVTLIDEPEAFLHPPQMRRIGSILSSELKNQLFVSTHSSDVIRGFLEKNNSRVRVIRIRRDGDINKTHEADSDKIKSIWENPDLKYTNALEGIFHDRCIVCEDDSDCRFYNAIWDHLELKSGVSPWPDVVFVPCGGKSAMPKLASAMIDLGVPTSMIFDIDLLSDENSFRKAIESIGGKWSEFETDWRILDSGVRKGLKAETPEEIKANIQGIIDRSQPPELPKSDIEAALKRRSPWQLVKSGGSGVIPKGDARKAFLTLQKNLANIGIFVVEVGEIENFAPSIGKHGPAFVSEVLTTIDLDSSELRLAREFVQSFR